MSLFPLKTQMFPMERFSKKEKSSALHFYIAHGNQKAATQWLGTVQKKYSGFVNAQDPRFQLTPLAVAAMARDVETARKLLGAGADAKLADVHGWTPLHFATLQQDEAMMTVLKTHDAGLAAIKNQAGLTPDALFDRTKVEPAGDDEQVFFYKNEAGEVVAGSAKTFRELTGATFTPRVVATPKGLAADWLRRAVNEENHRLRSSAATIDRYNQLSVDFFKQDQPDKFLSPPKVYMEKGPAGWGLFAGETIAPGTPIVPYGGELLEQMSDDPPEDDAYYYDGIEAKEKRHLGAMVNDSTPNAALTAEKYGDGLCRNCYVAALRKIEPGEQITVDYGWYADLKFDHRELKEAELEAQCRQIPLETLPQKVVDFAFMEKNFKSFVQLQSLFQYLMGTPSGLVHLLLKGLITPKQLAQFCANVPQFDTLQGDPGVIGKMGVYLRMVQQWYQHRPRLSNSLISELIELNRTHSIRLVLLVMQYIERSLEETSTPPSWEIVSPHLFVLEGVVAHLVSLERSFAKGELHQEAFLGYLKQIQQAPKILQSDLFVPIFGTLLQHNLLEQALEILESDPPLSTFAFSLIPEDLAHAIMNSVNA